MEIHLIVDQDLYDLCVPGDASTTAPEASAEKKRSAAEAGIGSTGSEAGSAEPAATGSTVEAAPAAPSKPASEAGSISSRRSATPEPAKKKKKVDPVSCLSSFGMTISYVTVEKKDRFQPHFGQFLKMHFLN